MQKLDTDDFGVSIMKDARLSEYTTFRLGGSAKGLISCRTDFELRNAIDYLNTLKERFILIGGGSNLVVSDRGLDCYVIRYVSEKPCILPFGNTLRVSGSTVLDDLALFAAENGLGGLNYLSGIPGTVGGAVVGNAGAFGKQIGDALDCACLMDYAGRENQVPRDELGFAYRHSILKKKPQIVASVTLKVEKTNPEGLLQERAEILAERKEKHPDLSKDPCAGSFFRNIEPTSKAGRRQATGWFLEEAGGKSLTVGGAAIYPKHANIIIRTDRCTAEDVFQLSQQMVQLAKEKFDLDLVREVRFVGDFNKKPSHIQDIIW